ncbi:Superfamily I DNA or RNA helicase [Desulfatibacillum alkenivorans DSM 16219]|uniref:DNA 3'-5' helicase n=1 Tax=Desulfatibacillum alkenivorans DSM 16219 TaxID=1121393 RepID=A0A1M6W6H2_9BACT|nr:ATP-dependent helicase [Desulfatibacillum alkenivorans]SHK89287.1 Superfamily I DNA or RNA helicase [Desulfatibacillum alkenivorans DSM 16219]
MELDLHQKAFIRSHDTLIALHGSGGTGKTECIIQLALCRLKLHSNITLIAYTNSAADEIRDRLLTCDTATGHTASVSVSTFHSLAFRTIKQYKQNVGYSNGIYLRPGVTSVVVRHLFKKYGHSRKKLNSVFTLYREHLLQSKSLTRLAQNRFKKAEDARVAIDIINKCKRVKKRQGVVDFDDIPYLFFRLVSKPDMANIMVKRYPLIICDEFQDVTDTQWKIFEVLIRTGLHFVGAGDPYQTIFAWSGASIRRFRQLEALPACKAYHLPINHRLPEPILNISHNIRTQIDNDAIRPIAKIGGDQLPKVVIHQYPDLIIKFLLQEVGRLHGVKGINLNDICVLYRFNQDANGLVRELVKRKIPYQIAGVDQIKSHLSEFVTALNYICYGTARKNQWKLVLSPLYGIGKQKTARILGDLGKGKYQYKVLKNHPQKSIRSLTSKLIALIERLKKADIKPPSMLTEIVTFYCEQPKTKRVQPNDPNFLILQDISRRSNGFEDFVARLNDPSYISQVRFDIDFPKDQFLNLMTIHRAKGREFKVVFILGSPNDLFRKYGRLASPKNMVEEAMILNTAVTRCCHRLYLLFQITEEAWMSNTVEKNAAQFIAQCDRNLYRFGEIA